jgi:DNA-binding PadR family transcriptional regulator
VTQESNIVSKGDYLGEFEHLVLLAVVRVEDGAYGLTVRQELEACTGREVTIGAVYSTLDRLESKGLLRSHRTAPESRPGGRSRRQFELTDNGRAALETSRSLIDRMWQGVQLDEPVD